MKRLLIVLFVICTVVSAVAQTNERRYLTSAELVANFPLHFANGFLMISVPIIDTLPSGTLDTVTKSFLIDPRASNDGSFLPGDSAETILGTRTFYSPVSPQRTLKLKLSPSFAKAPFKNADTNFFGVIGYGFFRQYITVIDFSTTSVSFYEMTPYPVMDKRLVTGAIHVPYLDDVILKYCHCPFPTMWLEPEAAPLLPGRMHFSLADRQSVIYESALSGALKKQINDGNLKDSLQGKFNKFTGIQLGEFKLGGVNLAQYEPRRPLDHVPDIFKDLTETVTGTVAIDLLKHFRAVIIDPTQSKILLCKY